VAKPPSALKALVNAAVAIGEEKKYPGIKPKKLVNAAFRQREDPEIVQAEEPQLASRPRGQIRNAKDVKRYENKRMYANSCLNFCNHKEGELKEL
jgi:hypothetical protein